MNETFGPLQKGLRIGLALFVPGVFLAMFFGHVNSLDRQRRVLEQLRPDAVARVVLRPLPGYPAPVPDSVAIADRPVAEALVAVYRNLSPFRHHGAPARHLATARHLGAARRPPGGVPAVPQRIRRPRLF